jgi:GR25 family glycosyltransferase involved in LPS biosynthesis
MYIIHLERATARAENIDKQMQTMSHDVTVFPAVDGKLLNIDTVSQDYDVNFAFTHGSPGEIACYLSHIQLLRHIEKNNHPHDPYVVVFEDDFSVTPNFRDEVMDVLRTLEEDKVEFDMLYLGNLSFYKGEPVRTRAKVTKICKNGKPCWGTQGYVVNVRSVGKLIAHIRDMKEAVDGAYQTGATRGDIVALVLDKTLVTQEGDTASFIRSVPYHLLTSSPKNSDDTS